MAPHGSEGVRDRLTSVVAGAGLVLEDVTVTPAGKRRVVRVVVDLPEDATGPLDLDVVADVSRAVSDALDDDDALGGSPYVLEVTSPGVDRPLTQRRHWARARGRLVAVPVDGPEVTGRVRAVDDEGVTLDVDGEQRVVPWPALGAGRVQVEFTRPGADDSDQDDTDQDDTDQDDSDQDDSDQDDSDQDDSDQDDAGGNGTDQRYDDGQEA